MSKKSKKPAYADIHSDKFDGTKMSQKELWASDSFTRGAALEQMDREHKGDYGYAMARERRQSDMTGFGMGKGGAMQAARYAGQMARSRAMAYNDDVTGQKERARMDQEGKDRGKAINSLRSDFDAYKKQQAEAGGPAEKPKGDMVIDSPSRPEAGESSFSQKYLEDGDVSRPKIFGGSNTPDAPDNKAGNEFDESTTADTPAKDPQKFADQYKLNLINTGATKNPNDEDKPELMPS